MSRHLFSESQLFVTNILYKVAHTNLSIASILSHFLKGTAYPMPVNVDKKVSFNHSILCCRRTFTNPSSKTAIKPLIVLVKRHKAFLEFCSFRYETKLLENHAVFILSDKKTNSHGSYVPSTISLSQWNGRRLT